MKTKNGAKVIIISGDKILLFLRDDKATIPYPNCWSFVGGGIEEGESPEEALKREVSEEACFKIKKFEFVKKVKGRLGENVWMYAVFVDKKDKGKFKIGVGEGQKVDWFTIEEALKLQLTPGVLDVLSNYANILARMMKEKRVVEEMKK